jgi:hypothetical protein
VIASNIIINPVILSLNLLDLISSWWAYSRLVETLPTIYGIQGCVPTFTNPVTAPYPGPGELFHNLTPFSFILMLSYRLHLDYSKWSPSFIFSDKIVHICLISPIRNPPRLYWWILRLFSDYRAQYSIRHLKDRICKSMCTARPPLWSSGQSSWLHNGDVFWFLWGTNRIYICYVEESRPPLWSSGHSSWLHNEVVFCFIWGTNRIYICYVEESRPPLWSSGQSSWLQIRRPGFDSRHYQKKSIGSGTGSTQPRKYNWGATW